MQIKPIDGAISTTVDGIKQGVKGVKNSLKPRDKKLVLLGEDGPGAIESFSNQPVDQTPSVESELRERKAVDHDGRDELRTAARLTADLEILLTQEDVFSGRMAELQKLEASYDQQIAQIKDICEKREKVVQEEEEMVKVAQKRIDKLLDELERMDTAKSMLQYQVSVCEDKLTEAQELIDNYSTIVRTFYYFMFYFYFCRWRRSSRPSIPAMHFASSRSFSATVLPSPALSPFGCETLAIEWLPRPAPPTSTGSPPCPASFPQRAHEVNE